VAKPRIDTVYEVLPNQLASRLANHSRDRIPVRVLSGSEWALPKYGIDTQPHQAVPLDRLKPDYSDRSWGYATGILVCWAETLNRTGLLAATGHEAIQRLRALNRPNLRGYRDYLYGVLKGARMQVDVVPAAWLTFPITEED
jgi:hypothetical protein